MCLGRDPALDHRAQVQDQTGGAAVQRGRKGNRRHAGAPRTALAGTLFFKYTCENLSGFFQTFIFVGLTIAFWFYIALWIESSGMLTSENNVNFNYKKDGAMMVSCKIFLNSQNKFLKLIIGSITIKQDKILK